MIKIIKGTYGRVVNGVVEAMTKRSAPFKLSEKREAELVAAGVAVKVEEPAEDNPYGSMKMSELRKAAADRGVDASGARYKKDIIALLEAYDEKQESGLLEED